MHDLIGYSIKLYFLVLLAQEGGHQGSSHAKPGWGQRNAIACKHGILLSMIKIFRTILLGIN